jgi:hypothetical protein
MSFPVIFYYVGHNKMTSFCEIIEKQLINSARGISQFEIPGERIITVIGELHLMEFACENGKTIYEYCMDRVNANTNCKFLFEYQPDVNVNFKRIGSNIIQDVFIRNGENDVKSRCRGVDSRLQFLGNERQQKLYNDHDGFAATYGNDNDALIHSDYVEVYVNNRKDPSETLCEKELRDYGDFIDNVFAEFSRDTPTRDELKWAWSMMMDYNVMWEMTRKCEDDEIINEIIVVLGENHRVNIFQSMKDWECCELIKNVNNLSGEKCVTNDKMKTICDLDV